MAICWGTHPLPPIGRWWGDDAYAIQDFRDAEKRGAVVCLAISSAPLFGHGDRRVDDRSPERSPACRPATAGGQLTQGVRGI